MKHIKVNSGRYIAAPEGECLSGTWNVRKKKAKSKGLKNTGIGGNGSFIYAGSASIIMMDKKGKPHDVSQAVRNFYDQRLSKKLFTKFCEELLEEKRIALFEDDKSWYHIKEIKP